MTKQPVPNKKGNAVHTLLGWLKGYVLIAIKHALNTAGATLTWTDKGEGTIPVEFTAHQDGLETDGYAPCEVIFFDPAA